MSTKSQRLTIFRDNFEKLGLTQKEFAALFGTSQGTISEKLSGNRRGINNTESLAIQLLVMLQKKKVNIRKLKISEDGLLL